MDRPSGSFFSTSGWIGASHYGRRMGVTHLPATATAEELHGILAAEGALVIDELASVELIDRITAEMADHVDATPFGSDDFSGRTTKRTGGLIARSEAARELVQHPLVLDVAERLMHQASKFQVHLTQIISIGPIRRASRSIATSGRSTSSPSRPTCIRSATRSGR